MYQDIERELDLYRKENRSAGNFLCALGLLCYTEFFGGVITGRFEAGWSKKNFDIFFGRLGPDYKKMLKSINIYNIFRCGLAHEYFIKGSSEVGLIPRKVRSVGLGLENGRYYFVVEKYYEDLVKAVEKPEEEKFPN